MAKWPPTVFMKKLIVMIGVVLATSFFNAFSGEVKISTPRNLKLEKIIVQGQKVLYVVNGGKEGKFTFLTDCDGKLAEIVRVLDDHKTILLSEINDSRLVEQVQINQEEWAKCLAKIAPVKVEVWAENYPTKETDMKYESLGTMFEGGSLKCVVKNSRGIISTMKDTELGVMPIEGRTFNFVAIDGKYYPAESLKQVKESAGDDKTFAILFRLE